MQKARIRLTWHLSSVHAAQLQFHHLAYPYRACYIQALSFFFFFFYKKEYIDQVGK